MIFKGCNIGFCYYNKHAWLYYNRMMRTEILSYMKHRLEASIEVLFIICLFFLIILLHWIKGQTLFLFIFDKYCIQKVAM